MNGNKERIQELIKQLNNAREAYYNLATPIMSDEVYDRLFDELDKLEKIEDLYYMNSPTHSVGFPIADSINKVEHTRSLLSLDKTKNVEDLLAFKQNHDALLMYKLDGLTVKLEYNHGEFVRASTRGNGDIGEDITHNAYAIVNIPKVIPYYEKLTIVGEAVILNDDFKQINSEYDDKYQNSRNLVSGSLRLLDSKKCNKRNIRFYAFSVVEGLENYNSKKDRLEYLSKSRFDICRFMDASSINDVESLESAITDLKKYADFEYIPIDGLVLSFDDIEYSEACGKTNHHYKDGIAFKFQDELFETRLLEIEWNTTRSGEISPVAIFEPVEIDGCTVSRATLHNLSIIHNLELGIGDRLLVSKRNMIIPKVEENLDRSNNIELPNYCLSCGAPTIKVTGKNGSVSLHCTNPDCKSQFIRRLVHFCKAMNIAGLSEGILTKLVNKGLIKSILDIYHLEQYKETIINMEGLGEKSYNAIIDAIEKSKDASFVSVMVALDIPLIGKTVSRILAKHCNNDLNCFIEEIDNEEHIFSFLDGIGFIADCNLNEWFKESKNRSFFESLLKEVNVIKKEVGVEKMSGNLFEDKKVVVTGTLKHYTRNDIQNLLIALGANPSKSVSKKTDYIIVGEKAGSKLTKAKELGIKVLNESEFISMINEEDERKIIQ